MKCGMVCTIVPHFLYVLQNVQGGKKFRMHFMFIHTLFLTTKTNKRALWPWVAHLSPSTYIDDALACGEGDWI